MKIEAKLGPGTLKTESVPANEALRRLERRIQKEGGVTFDAVAGQTNTEVMVDKSGVDLSQTSVLLGRERTINTTEHGRPATGKKADQLRARGGMNDSTSEFRTGKVIVEESTDPTYNSAVYEADLSDAPDALQNAVDQAWASIQANEIALAKQGEELPPELQARKKRLQPIVEARRAAQMQAEAPTASLTVEAASEKTGGTVEDFPAGSITPYNLDQMNRLPAPDQKIFESYRTKGWANLGKRQREDYRALKAKLDAARSDTEDGRNSDSIAA